MCTSRNPMVLQVSSPKGRRLSPSACVSEPEEKEISDDDDDDRNHKHRRRETRSQSLEEDSPEQIQMRPYRKRSKLFENGHPYRETNSQSSETWNRYSTAPLGKDLSAMFDKRRLDFETLARTPSRVNQPLSAELGPGRGRGRESGSWSQHDTRFRSFDIASQMVPHGSVAPSLFAGRGLPSVSNSHSASWSAFGLISGVPYGGLDTRHSLGLQGTFRPISAPLNMVVPRQRCRDFEERGFCLRGDMCPMEHGVNRIVVEDVQFNLPVSLPSAHLPSVSTPSNALLNTKSRSSKPGMVDDGVGMSSVFTDSAFAGGADFYDPDQPLWTNGCPETKTALLGLDPSKLDETRSLLDTETSDRRHARLFDGIDNQQQRRSTGTADGCQSTSSSVLERISAKRKLAMKENLASTLSFSNYIGNEGKEDQEPLSNLQGAACQGKGIILEDTVSQPIDSSPKTQRRIIRKPSQKALRTLFVNGIPQKDNKKEALLSHFRKFGDIIDIHIPLNSEQAFVQFSEREEAEAALKAPAAVMGNRFIKLWWANRDSILDDIMGSGNRASTAPHGVATALVAPHLYTALRGKDNFQSAAPKVSVPIASGAFVPALEHPKPVVTSSPKAPPALQKKMESLEHLKEELRKKQELLDQKRNDFRRQLDKLEKQATGLKGEVSSEQAAKRPKVGKVDEVAKPATPKSSDSVTIVASPQPELVAEKKKSADNVVHQTSNPPSTFVVPHEPSSLKQSIHPLAPAGAPFVLNRFKLDNRPTVFRITPPLPTGLVNVAVLKEHFSAFGELSSVELGDVECSDSVASKNCSARVSFTTRHSAERAFANGKCWQGHNLELIWLATGNSGTGSDDSVTGNPISISKSPAREVAPLDSRGVAAAANGEPENLERKASDGDCVEREEELQSGSPVVSSDKFSLKENVR